MGFVQLGALAASIYLLILTTRPKRVPSLGAVFGMACAAMSLLGFLGGMIGSSQLAATTVLVLAIVTGVVVAIKAARGGTFAIRTPRRPVGVWSLLAIMAVPLYFLNAGVPPLNFDVLSYHIPIARQLSASDGGYGVLWSPQTFYERLPLAAFVLESKVMGGGGYSMEVPLLMFLTIAAGASSVSRITAWLGGGANARGLAAVLYLFHPLVLGTFLNMLTDVMAAMFAVTALEMLLTGFSKSGRDWHFLAVGTLAGTAAAVKLSAIGVVCIPIGVMFLFASAARIRTEGVNPLLWRSLFFFHGVAVTIGVWLARAHYVGGSLLHPFGGFTEGWTQRQAEFVVAAHRPVSLLSGDWFTGFFTRSKVFGYSVGDMGLSFPAAFSFLLLAAVGALGLLRSRRKALAWLAMFPFIGYFFWLSLALNPERFFLPGVVMLIPSAALLINRGVHPRLRLICLAPLLLTVAIGSLISFKTALSYPRLLHAETRREFVEETNAPFMSAMRAANVRTSSGRSKTLILFESRATLFFGETVYNSVWDMPPWESLLRQSADAAEFRSLLRKQGFTNILVNEIEWGRLVDFYGGDRKREVQPSWNRIGVFSLTPESDAMTAYPPFVFAGFDDKDRRVLLEFLRESRRHATSAQPQMANSQTWSAPLDW